jgi:hypothetical protein
MVEGTHAENSGTREGEGWEREEGGRRVSIGPLGLVRVVSNAALPRSFPSLLLLAAPDGASDPSSARCTGVRRRGEERASQTAKQTKHTRTHTCTRTHVKARAAHLVATKECASERTSQTRLEGERYAARTPVNNEIQCMNAISYIL